MGGEGKMKREMRRRKEGGKEGKYKRQILFPDALFGFIFP